MTLSFSPSRRLSIILPLMAFVVIVTALAVAPAAQAATYDPEEVRFLYLINQYRQSIGVQPLQMNTKLSNASEFYSAYMGQTNCFSHTCGGTTYLERQRSYGYTYNTWTGENLAAGTLWDTGQEAFDAWKASPGHDANMRNANYCAIGVARVNTPGSYYGWYWTTEFGGVCENDPQPPMDTTPPAVTITSPSSGLASGIVDFRADASDNTGLSRVDLYVDGALVGQSTIPPFSYVWDVRSLSGTHTISAIAYDTWNNSNSSSRQVTIDNFSPTKRYVFTWYDQSSGDWKDWVLMANPAGGAGSSRTSALVGGLTYADRNISPGAAAETPQFPGVMGGPVIVQATQPLITSQRVLYKQSFNEIAGILSTDLSTTYYFTWYDSSAANGMLGDWILIGNQGNATANVQVYIGGVLKGTYSVPVGDKVTPSYPNLTDGPVKVVSTNGQPLIVSQRVLYKDSFNEVLGVPDSRLSSDYRFTWYDDKPENFMRGNWILIGNQDVGTADVDVYIGGVKMGSYSVPEGGRVTPQYPGVMNGPVRVVSTNGKKLIVSQRILFKDSFEEFQGLTGPEFGTDLWFTWYDSLPSNGMNGNWILIANQGNSTANVDIYIGGVLRQSLSLPVGGNQPLSFPNTMNGPVRVVSTNGVPLMATQRVVFMNSFNEIGGVQLR